MSLDLDAIRQRVKRANDEVFGLADGSRKWTMRIPAEPERDSDLVLAAVLDDADKLLAEVARLRGVLLKPCPDCGAPVQGVRCPDCQPQEVKR